MIKRLLHNKMVVFGTVVILAMIFLAVAAPWLTPYDYKTNHLGERLPFRLVFLFKIVFFLEEEQDADWNRSGITQS